MKFISNLVLVALAIRSNIEKLGFELPDSSREMAGC